MPAELDPDDAAAAWVLDRAEQYDPATGIHDALLELAEGLARGDHLEALRHGELDDLAERIMFVKCSPREPSRLCGRCAGEGSVIKRGKDGGFLDVDCGACGGTGRSHLALVKGG